MLDQKKSSSIFSFSSGQRNILGYIVLFFAPIIVVAAILESMVIDLPSTYKITADYLEAEQQHVNVAIFGSSQIKNSVNPEFIGQNAVNLSSSAQHHNTDFKILKGLRERLSNLETVVFEVSYSHFEIPHNSKYYWKNSLFLKYYNVNTFGRATTLSDRLLYVSHPGYFSELFVDYYVRDSLPYAYNKWAFDNNYYQGKFKRLDYDVKKVAASAVKINKREDLKTLAYNAAYFRDMMEYCKKEGLNVVIISPPTYTNYTAQRNTNILRRRDSVLSVIKRDYPDVSILISESDTEFNVRHFRNENHMNPDGAKVFTKKLDAVLEQMD